MFLQEIKSVARRKRRARAFRDWKSNSMEKGIPRHCSWQPGCKKNTRALRQKRPLESPSGGPVRLRAAFFLQTDLESSGTCLAFVAFPIIEGSE